VIGLLDASEVFVGREKHGKAEDIMTVPRSLSKSKGCTRVQRKTDLTLRLYVLRKRGMVPQNNSQWHNFVLAWPLK